MVRVVSVDAASAPRSSLVPASRNGTTSYGTSYGVFNGLSDVPAYGGARHHKSSVYRHAAGRPSLGGGGSLVRHASFGSRSRSRSTNLDSDADVLTAGVVTPLPFASYAAYGGHSGQTYASASSGGSHRSSGTSVHLCRCGSGGPLLPANTSPPSLPPLQHGSSQLPTSAYSRLVQSLPSTPNASRRPVSPMRPSCQMQPQHLDSSQPPTGPMAALHLQQQQPPNNQPPGQPLPQQMYGATGTDCGLGAGPPPRPLLPPNDSPASFRTDPRRGPGAGDAPPGRPAPKGLRALHQWTRGQRARSNSRGRALTARSPLTHSGGVQPLMKLSTLVIVLLAFLIIGFIVLSPLFHYLM